MIPNSRHDPRHSRQLSRAGSRDLSLKSKQILPKELDNDSRLAKAISDAKQILHDAARDFIIDQQQQLPPAQTEPLVLLDFSLNQLIRRNRRPLPLARAVYVRMLEQLFRRPVMSLARFLLLTRDRPSTASGDPRPPSHTLRHELTELRRRVGEFDLPIEIERCERGIRARFDCSRLKVNVIQGQLLARKATTRLAICDFGGAIEFAEQALTTDFDCGLAAWLVAQVSQKRQDHLNTAVVMRTEACLARSMLRYAATIQRLLRSRGRYDPDVARAQQLAERMLVRLRRHWHTLGSWPFGDAPYEPSFRDHRTSFRELVDLLIEARRPNGALSFDRFAKNPIVVEIVDQLLEERLGESGPRGRKDAIENLTIEILMKLAMTGWSPLPAMSKGEVRKQLLSFLRAHRIDWNKIFHRSPARAARFRDDLYGRSKVRSSDPRDDDNDNEDSYHGNGEKADEGLDDE